MQQKSVSAYDRSKASSRISHNSHKSNTEVGNIDQMIEEEIRTSIDSPYKEHKQVDEAIQTRSLNGTESQIDATEEELNTFVKMESIQASDGENRDESNTQIQKLIEEPLTVDRENTSNGSEKNIAVDTELLNEQDIQFYNSLLHHADRLEFPKAILDKLKYSIKLDEDMWNNITSFYYKKNSEF